MDRNDVQPGVKVRCIRLRETPKDNHPFVQVGSVYTILRHSRFRHGYVLLEETTKKSGRNLLFGLGDFEVFDPKKDTDDAWDRAMKGV